MGSEHRLQLLAGSPCIFFDNVRGDSNLGGVLEAILTMPNYSMRIMGGNKRAEVSTQSLILISANNFQPQGDLFRRVLTCRLDAGIERPEGRRFDFDPRQECL
jgi:putative DNA primase/helicase